MLDAATAIKAGLMARGMPEHVADAFVMNFRDESGLNPGINEIAPVVPGSRGGYGLAQWTGPRRVALEAFAAERGMPVSDLETQLDFLMTELRGSEARAGGAIMTAPDRASAAQAILTEFLRPAPEHAVRRSAAYGGVTGSTGGNALETPQPGVAGPNMLAVPQLAGSYVDPAAFMRQPNALAPHPLAYNRRPLGSIT
jgi:Phage tail lysozyme